MTLPTIKGSLIELTAIDLTPTGRTRIVVMPVLPPTMAPAITSPGATSLITPLSSATAASKGPAK